MVITLTKTVGGQTVTVTMPNTKKVTYAPETVSTQTTMADGSICTDIVGVRRAWKASWDAVPPATMEALYGLLAATRVANCTIKGIDGTAVTVTANVEISDTTWYSDRENLPNWRGVSLAIKERTVQRGTVSV